MIMNMIDFLIMKITVKITLGKGSAGELFQHRIGSSGVSKDLLLAIGSGTFSWVVKIIVKCYCQKLSKFNKT